MNKKDFRQLVIEPIAYIRTDFPTKFGIPRQGDIVTSLKGEIIFEEKFRKEGILRELENFSHLWLIWGFSGFDEQEFSPTVRPPKLGGNKRVGVFASRSPNRPNPLGMTAVRIEEIILEGKDAPKIIVSGVDLMDNTPIYDIKPYIPFSDSIPDAKEGYTALTRQKEKLMVSISDELKAKMPQNKLSSLISLLEEDPRPGFQHDPERIYGFPFAGFEIRFRVTENQLEVLSLEII